MGRIGLPNKDYFIWFDDYEYALRIQRQTDAAIVAVPDALFFHDYGGVARHVRFLWKRIIRNPQPPWKTYYEARNQLYTFTRTAGNGPELRQYFLIHLRALIADLLYESERWERARMRLLGVRDGAIGRLGKRV